VVTVPRVDPRPGALALPASAPSCGGPSAWVSLRVGAKESTRPTGCGTISASRNPSGATPAWPWAASWLRSLLAVVSTKDEEHFRTSPGGYFHGMVDKAKTGELHLERTVWALRRAAGSAPADGQGRGALRP
jgi:hypothetical protein